MMPVNLAGEGWPRLYPSGGLHGKLVHALGRQIVNGDLRPGQLLPSVVDMLRRHEVSRTSIREALRVLATKGLIAQRQRAGSWVRPMQDWNLLDPDILNWYRLDQVTPEFLQHLNEVRLCVEPMAARMTARAATDAEIAAILACFATMEEQAAEPELAGFYDADLAFHVAVFDGCHNPFMIQLCRGILPALRMGFEVHRHFNVRLKYREDMRNVVCPMHQDLAQAIERRDEAGAEGAMRAIIENAIGELERFVGDSAWRNGAPASERPAPANVNG